MLETSLPSSPFSSTSTSTSIDSLPLANDVSDWGSQDVAIAAFLMLLWKDMYPSRSESGEGKGEGEGEEWSKWGRPPRGFIDLGCVSPTFHVDSRSRGRARLMTGKWSTCSHPGL